MTLELSHLPGVPQRLAIVRVDELIKYRPQVAFPFPAAFVVPLEADADVHPTRGLRKHPAVEWGYPAVEDHIQPSRRQRGIFPPPHQRRDLPPRPPVGREDRVRAIGAKNETAIELSPVETLDSHHATAIAQQLSGAKAFLHFHPHRSSPIHQQV